MILLLAHKSDRDAAWLHEKLKNHVKIEFVTMEDLVTSHSISINISNTGQTTYVFQISDGRIIRSQSVTHLMDRVIHVPAEASLLIMPKDKSYTQIEWQAIYSCIVNNGAINIFNNSCPGALGGRSRQPEEWLYLALQCGFKNAALYSKNDILTNRTFATDIIAFDKKLYELPVEDPFLKGKLLKLLELSEEKILGISYMKSGNQVFFVDANTVPERLHLAGDKFIQDIISILHYDFIMRHTG